MMYPIRLKKYLHLILLPLLSSCMGYQNNILFRTGEEFDNTVFDKYKAEAEQNYKLAHFDYITVQLFTNKGEILIDPNGDFTQELANGQSQNQNIRNSSQFENDFSGIPQPTNIGVAGVGQQGRVGGLRRYLIQEDDSVALPMIGRVKLSGLTLYQADSLLAIKYAEFYESPYVITRYVNKRVIVMGAMGNKVISLNNENMTLLEILTLAGDLNNNVRANRIRLIRNANTGKPVMKSIDLSTWEGVKSAELIVQPNDVVYIEPRRRVGAEFLQDFTQVASAIGSSVTLILTILLLQDRFGGN